jgi:hypothetical protein
MRLRFAPRLRPFRHAIGAVCFGALGLTLMLLHRVAHAQAVPDPLGVAQASVDGARCCS